MLSGLSVFWKFFTLAAAFKVLLFPAYRSTDFEVHRNWLAITHSLPANRWYVEDTSEWTLDYPPFFAYFEWLLSQLAKYVDPKMLLVDNLNYASDNTVYFQRSSVIVTDLLFAWGVIRCLNALKIPKETQQRRATEMALLWNVGLIFVDHIHFQYNGFLFGILLLSMSYMLEERYLLATFLFATLLNFKHIFLYVAPAFGAYLLKFYCLDITRNTPRRLVKLIVVGLVPFILSFGPFYKQLPQVFSRLFPFKRGLTHAYWAPNFWAVYNTADKVAAFALGIRSDGESTTIGLVKDFEHVVLPTISPAVTFMMTMIFMLPCIIKLCCYTERKDSHKVFVRSVVICSLTAFIFGWHVHEKAILMTLIPLSLLSMTDSIEAKFTYMLSIPGLFSLFPLLFHVDLIVIRYSLFGFYVAGMYGQIQRVFKEPPSLKIYEWIFKWGLVSLPLYEFIVAPLFGLNEKLPFMPLLLTSLYCSIGIMYFFISYYLHMLQLHEILSCKPKSYSKKKSKLKAKKKTK